MQLKCSRSRSFDCYRSKSRVYSKHRKGKKTVFLSDKLVDVCRYVMYVRTYVRTIQYDTIQAPTQNCTYPSRIFLATLLPTAKERETKKRPVEKKNAAGYLPAAAEFHYLGCHEVVTNLTTRTRFQISNSRFRIGRTD